MRTLVSESKRRVETQTADIGVKPAPLISSEETYNKFNALKTFGDSYAPVFARDENNMVMGGAAKSAKLAALEGELTPAASVFKGVYDVIQEVGGPMGLPKVSDEEFSEMYNKVVYTPFKDWDQELDRGKRLDPELANEIYPLPEDKRWTEPVYEGAAKEKYNNYLRDLAIDHALEKSSTGRSLMMELMYGLGAGATDFPNIALGAVPFARLASFGRYGKFFTTGKGKIAESAFDNAVAGAGLEVANYHAQNQSGGIYTVTESAANWGFGTVAGVGMTGIQAGSKAIFNPTNKMQDASMNVLSTYGEHKAYKDITPEYREAKVAFYQAENMKAKSDQHLYDGDRNGSEKMQREYQEEVDAMEEDLGLKKEEQPQEPTEPEATQEVVSQEEVDTATAEAQSKVEKFANAFREQTKVLVDSFTEVFPGLRQLNSEGKIKVVRNASEIDNAKHRALLEAGEADGSRKDGFFVINEDEIYIITDEIGGDSVGAKTNKAVDILIEEGVFHYGLRKSLGDQDFDNMINRVLHFHEDEIDTYRKLYGENISDQALAEEVITDIFKGELYDTNILREFVSKITRQHKSISSDTQVTKAVNKAFDRMREDGRFGVPTNLRLSDSDREEIVKTHEQINTLKRELEQYKADRKSFEVENKVLGDDSYAKDIEVLDSYIKDLDSQISGLQEKIDTFKKSEVRFSTAKASKATAQQAKKQKEIDQARFTKFLEGDLKGETLLEGIYDPDGNLASVVNKRDKLLTVQVLEDHLEKIRTMDYYDSHDYFDRLIHEEIEGEGNAIYAKYVTDFYQKVSELGIPFTDVQTGKYDLELHKASQGMSNDTDAIAIWNIMESVNQQYVKDRNMSGGALQYLSDRVAKQTHNPQAIFKAAEAKWITGRKIGKKSTQWEAEKDKAFQYWKKLMLDNLDHERSFHRRGLTTYEQKLKSLQGAWDGIVSSIHGKQDVDLSLGNPNNKHAQDAHRLYHFKDAESAYSYNKKFGTATVVESFLNDLNGGSKTISINKRLGPYYRDAWEKIVLPTLKSKAQGLSPKEAAQIDKLNKSFEMTMERMEGTLSRPEHVTLDFVNKVIKSIVVTSKLGSTLYASVSDTALVNRTLQRLEAGDNVEAIKALRKSLPETLNAAFGFARPKTAAEKEVLKLVAGDIESILGSFMSRFDVEGIGFNRADRALTRFTNFAYTVNGMNRWNRAMRDGFTVAVVRRMGEYAKYDLDSLEGIASGARADFKRMGITSKEWDAIRSARSDVQGRSVLTMDSLANIDEVKIRDILASKGRQATAQAITREKKRLQGLYLGYLRNLMDEAVLTPGMRQKNLLIGSSQPGSVVYTFRSLLLMFKSFPITAWQKIARQDAKNFKAGGATQLATVIAFTTFLQYLSRNAQNYAEGRSAIPMNSMSTWFDMMLKGGALGIVGDVIFNPYDERGRDVGGMVAGPALSQLGSGMAVLWKTARAIAEEGETDPDKIESLQRQWFNLLKNNTPLQNNIILKPIMEATILKSIYAAIDPDRNERYRNQLEKRGMTLNEQRKADIFFSTLFAPQ